MLGKLVNALQICRDMNFWIDLISQDWRHVACRMYQTRSLGSLPVMYDVEQGPRFHRVMLQRAQAAVLCFLLMPIILRLFGSGLPWGFDPIPASSWK